MGRIRFFVNEAGIVSVGELPNIESEIRSLNELLECSREKYPRMSEEELLEVCVYIEMDGEDCPILDQDEEIVYLLSPEELALIQKKCRH